MAEAEQRRLDEVRRREEANRAEQEKRPSDEDAKEREFLDKLWDLRAKFLQPGRPAPDPYAIPGLVLHVGFDDPDVIWPRTAGRLEWSSGAGPAPGPRGTALYLPPNGKVTLLAPSDALKAVLDRPLTVAGWVKLRYRPVTLFQVHDRRGLLPLGHLTAGGKRLVFNTRTGFNPWEDEGNDGKNTPDAAYRLRPPWGRDDGWHHVAAVRVRRGAEERVLIYLDGVAKADAAVPPWSWSLWVCGIPAPDPGSGTPRGRTFRVPAHLQGAFGHLTSPGSGTAFPYRLGITRDGSAAWFAAAADPSKPAPCDWGRTDPRTGEPTGRSSFGADLPLGFGHSHDWALAPGGGRFVPHEGNLIEVRPVAAGRPADRRLVIPAIRAESSRVRLGLTADGRFLFCSYPHAAPAEDRLTVVETDPTAAKPLTATLRGEPKAYSVPFWVSPDGAVVVFLSGRVVRVSYPTGRAPQPPRWPFAPRSSPSPLPPTCPVVGRATPPRFRGWRSTSPSTGRRARGPARG